MSVAGKRLIAAAQEALAIAKGEKQPGRLHVPADIDVKLVRKSLKLSQDDFAAEFGFSVNQIRDWEQGRSRPLGAARAYLMLIEAHPDSVRQMLNDIKRAEPKAA
jgi:putative transcriptional regulator